MNPMDYPLLILAFSLLLLWFATWIGANHFPKLRAQISEHHDEFEVIHAATLTLLGLIIGFSFSMAVSRYDQRKNLEEAEANAIGTELVRAELLPELEAAHVKKLLVEYLDARVRFYEERDKAVLAEIDARTAKLQAELWASVRTTALARADPITALVVSGMNDVLNSQGYTLAAWRNRIPEGAWIMMEVIAFIAAFLAGLGTRAPNATRGLLMLLTFVVSIAFFLIADIDSPRGGIIHVAPHNLLSVLPAPAPR